MCGPTSGQAQVQNSQIDFMNTLSSEYKNVFGQSQGILSSLTSAFQPILQAGINQRGFSDAERNSMNAQATEGTAVNYDQAKRALQENQAAQNGDSQLTPGQDAQQQEELAATAAGTRSAQEQEITQADYATGRQNFMNASGTLGGVAAQLNPNGMAGAVTNSSEAAGNTANQIAQQGNSVWTSVMGALGGVAGMAAGNYMGGLAKLPAATPAAATPAVP